MKMKTRCLPVLVIITVCFLGFSDEQRRPPRCALSRLDIVKCIYRDGTRRASYNERSFHFTRLLERENGSIICRARPLNEIVAPITVAGSNNTIILFSPGFLRNIRYKNKLLGQFNVSCGDGKIAYYSVTDLEMQDNPCFYLGTSGHNRKLCQDYVLINDGTRGAFDICGNLNDVHINQRSGYTTNGTLNVTFRTSEIFRSRGFKMYAVCINESDYQTWNNSKQSRKKRNMNEAVCLQPSDFEECPNKNGTGDPVRGKRSTEQTSTGSSKIKVCISRAAKTGCGCNPADNTPSPTHEPPILTPEEEQVMLELTQTLYASISLSEDIIPVDECYETDEDDDDKFDDEITDTPSETYLKPEALFTALKYREACNPILRQQANSVIALFAQNASEIINSYLNFSISCTLNNGAHNLVLNCEVEEGFAPPLNDSTYCTPSNGTYTGTPQKCSLFNEPFDNEVNSVTVKAINCNGQRATVIARKMI